MAEHALGPHFVKIDYAAQGRRHTMTLPVVLSQLNPAEEPPEGEKYVFMQRNGGFIVANQAVQTLVDFLRPFYAASDAFLSWSLWYQVIPVATPVFLDGDALSPGAGTNVAASKAMTQAVLSFRSRANNRFRLYLMEGVFTPNEVRQYPFTGVQELSDLAGYLTSAACWVGARDNEYLATSVRFTTKTNDVLRKKVLS